MERKKKKRIEPKHFAIRCHNEYVCIQFERNRVTIQFWLWQKVQLLQLHLPRQTGHFLFSELCTMAWHFIDIQHDTNLNGYLLISCLVLMVQSVLMMFRKAGQGRAGQNSLVYQFTYTHTMSHTRALIKYC